MHRNQHIAELGPLLLRTGIRHVILCPGSRNAPLIELFTSMDGFRCHSIVDERSAAYVALGMARELGTPVAVVTTSGTAVMNLAPALAEASFQQLPLVLITADRPRERISQFDNQVIRQKEALLSHARAFFELPLQVPDRQRMEEVLLSVEEAVRRGMDFPGGPLHLNVPLLEPLYEPLPPPLGGPVRSPLTPQTGTGGDRQAVEIFAKHMEEGHKVLIMAGMGSPDPGLSGLLEALTGCGQVAVVAENIANLHSERFIANPELVLAGADERERIGLLPRLVVSFGGQVVSKRLRLFLEQQGGEGRTPFSGTSGGELLFHEITGEPSATLKYMYLAGAQAKNTYLEEWKRIEHREIASAARFLDRAPHCNLAAVHTILAALPEGSVLHLGNSGAIRYSQLVPPVPGIACHANRGTSGIDGCVSSAVGAAMVSDRLHVLVVGDLSFVYDSNGLWNSHFPDNLRIIVLNDGGGGIFRLLEGPSRMAFFEEFSVTHHPVSLELLSAAFGRGFRRAADRGELAGMLEVLFRPDSGISVLEVDTTAGENSHIFKEFFRRNR